MGPLKIFIFKHKLRIFGWSAIIIATGLLWLFREHLAGLASVLWPIIAGATILGFRNELSNLLKRVKSVGKQGMEFGDEQIAAQILAVPVSDALKDVAPNEEHTELIKERVSSLRFELNSKQPNDNVKREHLLILRLAEAQQFRDFQNIWMNIFASQLEALTKMASESNYVELSEYFQTHQGRVESLASPPAVKVSFEGWSAYFTRMQLATIEQKSGAITQFGKDFLTFGAKQSLPRFQGL